MICKSLLGKAHTVMAEGGVAAALANVDDRDNWKVHFSDTMRGGQYLNNWRMAELHAKEAPDRVRELEAWGAVFDRTPDGRILQRNFGGHRYPRLAHVGDRTGLEMIRTLQDHGIHQGIDVYMEHTVVTLLKDGDRIAGAFGYDRERGRFHLFRAKAVVLATGGIGRAYQDHQQQLGIHRRRPGAGLRRRRRADGHGVRPVPSDRHGLAAERARHPGHRRRARRRRRAAQQGRQALHVRRHSAENYANQTADNEEEGWRYTQGDKNARRPPELLTRDHVARCIGREVKEGRGSPHGGVFLDIAWIKEKLPNAAEHIKRKLPSMYHQFKQLADIDITKEPMEVGPTTHYMMGGIRVDGDTQMSSVPGPVRRRRVRRRPARRQPPGRQFAVRSAGLRQARRRVRREVRQGATRSAQSIQEQVERRRAARASAVRRAKAPRIPTPSSTSCRTRCRTWSASCAARAR